MKTIKLKEEVLIKERIIYVCEVCDTQYDHKYNVTVCEKNHEQEECKHENIEYELDTEYAWYDCDVIKKCKDCKKEIWKFDIDIYENNQEALSKIYEVLDNHK